MERFFVLCGSVMMFLGVCAGAFGAHGLKDYFSQYPQYQDTFEKAVRYQFYHALGLFAVAWLAGKWPGALTAWAGFFFLAGIVLFSGSLYVLVFTRTNWLGAITPFGGVSFLVGWALLFLAAWARKGG